MNFWKDKRVLITGNTGFKGSWLSVWLNMLGADIRGYALQPTEKKSLFLRLGVGGFCPTTFSDIRNEKMVTKLIVEFKPEIIFHLAAQPLVQESYLHPRSTFETNIMGTINIIEGAMNVNSVQSIVNVTSDKVYENHSLQRGYKEIDTLNGKDPYSNSKSCADLISNCYRNSFLEGKINLANVRSGNVIGGGDWAEKRLIPDMMRSLADNNVLNIRNPDSTRPWQHVLEPLFGYMLLAKKLYSDPSYAEDWNFGPEEGDNASVGQIAEKYTKYWGKPVKVSSGKDKFAEAKYLKLDSGKSKAKLDWRPVWQLDKSIEKTFQWYEQATLHDNMHTFTLAQIEEYSSEQDFKW
jgi:CDP-glucose 4,6-dehydratase